MTWQSETRAWALASASVFCLSALGYRVMTAPALPDLAPTVQRANAVLDTVNAPCKDNGHQVVCGTLQQVAQSTKNIGIVAAQSAEQVKQSGKLINTASQSLRSVAESARGAIVTTQEQITHVAPLLDSLRASSDSIPPALDHVTADADGIRPLLANANGSVTDLRRFLQAPALTDTLGNAASMTASWAAISGDARQVADRATANYLKPVPWYLWPVKRGGEVLDIGAAVARHTP